MTAKSDFGPLVASASARVTTVTDGIGRGAVG
ncbi:hypothetical protein QF030_006646 [Streptomyces rishiriensis]|uniref:Uncharacterized protein n=1 Tax=Streptomyces rishiriensis TaxID=68264 RepID=A0ABU0P0J4_STRRH|nr:hypothetical protein [Streptomyces rishiriensis]